VYKRDSTQRIALWSKIFTFVAIAGFFAGLIGVAAKWILMLDVVYFLSYVKMAVTVVKYCPQVKKKRNCFNSESLLFFSSFSLFMCCCY